MHKYLARLPVDLWQLLCEAKKQSGRSINAEIIWRLRRSFDGYRQ